MKPLLRMTVLVAVTLPALIALGWWQLERGELKRTLEMAYMEQLTQLPVRASSIGALQSFSRVRLIGRYAQEIYLVDNQVHDGVVGYWVVQAFDEDGGHRYLVNRGFVPGMPRRDELPDITTPNGVVDVVGMRWPDLGLVPVLEADSWQAGWPKRVQRLDVERLASTVGARDAEIRLEPGQAGVLVAAPFAAVLSDAKHLGYAATWFGLALVVFVGYVVFALRARA